MQNNENVSKGLGNQVDKKIELFENKLHILVTIIEEKDAFINELQKKMKEMETKFTTENKFKDAKLDMFEKKLDNLLNENEIMSG